jgi:hypothetical protein
MCIDLYQFLPNYCIWRFQISSVRSLFLQLTCNWKRDYILLDPFYVRVAHPPQPCYKCGNPVVLSVGRLAKQEEAFRQHHHHAAVLEITNCLVTANHQRAYLFALLTIGKFPASYTNPKFSIVFTFSHYITLSRILTCLEIFFFA